MLYKVFTKLWFYVFLNQRIYQLNNVQEIPDNRATKSLDHQLLSYRKFKKQLKEYNYRQAILISRLYQSSYLLNIRILFQKLMRGEQELDSSSEQLSDQLANYFSKGFSRKGLIRRLQEDPGFAQVLQREYLQLYRKCNRLQGQQDKFVHKFDVLRNHKIEEKNTIHNLEQSIFEFKTRLNALHTALKQVRSETKVLQIKRQQILDKHQQTTKLETVQNIKQKSSMDEKIDQMQKMLNKKPDTDIMDEILSITEGFIKNIQKIKISDEKFQLIQEDKKQAVEINQTNQSIVLPYEKQLCQTHQHFVNLIKNLETADALDRLSNDSQFAKRILSNYLSLYDDDVKHCQMLKNILDLSSKYLEEQKKILQHNQLLRHSYQQLKKNAMATFNQIQNRFQKAAKELQLNLTKLLDQLLSAEKQELRCIIAKSAKPQIDKFLEFINDQESQEVKEKIVQVCEKWLKQLNQCKKNLKPLKKKLQQKKKNIQCYLIASRNIL